MSLLVVRVMGGFDLYPTAKFHWHLSHQHGPLHNKDDQPAVELNDGTKIWYNTGKIHRVSGPAIRWADGTNEWRVDPTILTLPKRDV